MTISCADARSTLLSPVADADMRRAAQQHVLTCDVCSPDLGPSELDEQITMIERFIRGRRLRSEEPRLNSSHT